MPLYVVLDHSALIPYGDKPEEEKEAIRRLGDLLPKCNVVWYVSRSYLKTLYMVFLRELKHYREELKRYPLPRLQSSLMKVLKSLLELLDTKVWHCRERGLRGTELKLHVVARTAFKHIDPELQAMWGRLGSLSEDDLEVLALTVTSVSYASDPLHLVIADRPLLQTAEQLAQLAGLKVRILAPRQLVELISEDTV